MNGGRTIYMFMFMQSDDFENDSSNGLIFEKMFEVHLLNQTFSLIFSKILLFSIIFLENVRQSFQV